MQAGPGRRIGKLAAFGLIRALVRLRRLRFPVRPLRREDVRSILLVETAFLGDVIAATPAIRALAGSFPAAEITAVVRSPYTALLSGDPRVAAVIPYRQNSPASAAGIVAQCRRKRFDVVVCASPGVNNALISILCGRLFVSGYLVNRSRNPHFFQDQTSEGVGLGGRWVSRRDEHLTVRALKALAPLGVLPQPSRSRTELRLDPEVEQRALADLAGRGLVRDRPLSVVVHPAAAWRFKQWPIERFSAVLEGLYARFGDRLSVTVVGVPQEEPLLGGLRRATARPLRFLVGGGIETLMALVKHCDLFIGNDSGPKHIADAFGRPVLEILGPSLPGTVGATNERAVSLYRPVACSPCDQQRCNHDALCMRQIGVQEVLDLSADVLARADRDRR